MFGSLVQIEKGKGERDGKKGEEGSMKKIETQSKEEENW